MRPLIAGAVVAALMSCGLTQWLPTFSIMGLLADDLTTAMLLFIIPGVAGNYALGPTLAMVQTLSPVNMRAVSAAIKMLFINLIGMGLGPFLALRPRIGEAIQGA
ncbi:MAG: hypothetical protein ACJAZ0_002099 [Halioglobus sp.]|jgi:hypothetical protein